VDEHQVKEWRSFLKDHGPKDFFEEMLRRRDIPPRKLGIAFGIHPELGFDDDTVARLLGVAVYRAFYRRKKLPEYNTIDDAAELLKRSQHIIVITGAGISTSLGIPDFRSKGTGFYDKVAQLGFSEPQDVFDIQIFDDDPQLFYNLAGDVLPDHNIGVSPTHAFLKLLQDQNRLQRNYTQNIDDLEALAGLDRDRIVQCHGSFATATCRKCRTKVDGKEIFRDIRGKTVARCKAPDCHRLSRRLLQSLHLPSRRPAKRSKSCHFDDSDEDDDVPEPGVMKPDITFFGEQLPDNFFDKFTQEDAQAADLVIVIGTSLKVAPVSEMPNYISQQTPHIYISMEAIRHVEFDIQLLGKCDDVVVELCRRAGWELKHPKVQSDPLEVMAVPERDHLWVVAPVGREMPCPQNDSLKKDEDGDEKGKEKIVAVVRERRSIREEASAEIGALVAAAATSRKTASAPRPPTGAHEVIDLT
jgi:NAD-dependent histone deacetylase SIR2